MLKFIFPTLFGCLITLGSFSQIEIDTTRTPQYLVEQILLGTGVEVSNIQYNGSTANAQQIRATAGRFFGNSTVGIPNGVILSCGNVREAVGPNESTSSSDNENVEDYTSDTDLQSLQTGGTSIHDGAVLEFDFTPSGDSISFQYVFASEEYNEFAPPNNSSYNDAFGFFLTGPNPDGGTYNAQNIATLDNGTIVSINNINAITNQAFFVDNDNSASGNPDQTLEYDGLTVPLTAAAKVTCGETYHIKLAISDAGDQSYNSAIFLEANSFASNAVSVSVTSVTGDSTLIEGCGNAQFVFSRPVNDTLDTLIVSYDISGSATNGTDYDELADSVVFEPGIDTVIVILNPINDGVSEDPEEVTITAYTVNACGDTITSTGTIWIFDPEVGVVVNDTTVSCPREDSVLLVATPTVGLAPFTFEWSTGETNDSIWVPINTIGSTDYTVTVSDQCPYTGTDIGTVTVNEFQASLTGFPTSGEAPLSVEFTNQSTSGQNYEWNFMNGSPNVFVNDLSSQNAVYDSIGDYYPQLIVTNAEGCVDTAAVGIYVLGKPTIEAPNVFSPNGDGVNDYYHFIDVSNISEFKCYILNRWGNVLREFDNVSDTWDGKNKSGGEVPEGVYFYKYEGKSQAGQEVNGHGFIQLVR